MHSLFEKYGYNVPSLYVKSAPQTFHIRSVFVQARIMAPCLLIFEDIDTIVTSATRSYFFNEVDGLENNDGLFMVASTNHLDKLDPGLSSRPSRFDRKYLFPLPSEWERTLYCEYWRGKLKPKPGIIFPKKLSPAIAGITEDFSFAYLKEAFVATLLVIAGNRSEEGKLSEGLVQGGGDDDGGDKDGDLDDYELWREMKKQVKQLRDDMDNRGVLAKMSNLNTVSDTESSHEGVETSATPQHPTQISRQPDGRPEEIDTSHEDVETPAKAGGPVHSSQAFGLTVAQSRAIVSAGTHLDCDFQHAPLMTDEGMFMDSRFNGL